jgi:hypothetical protein
MKGTTMETKIDAEEMLAELLFEWNATVQPRSMVLGLTELIKQAEVEPLSLTRTTKLLKLNLKLTEIKNLYPNLYVF